MSTHSDYLFRIVSPEFRIPYSVPGIPVGIIALVWGALLVNTNQYQGTVSLDSFSEKSISIFTPTPDVITIAGIRKAVKLNKGTDEISELWEAFYNARDLHMAISEDSSERVYAYYQFKISDFSSADLEIGYNSNGKEFDGYAVFPPIFTRDYVQTYQSGELWDTTPGWDAIDGSRELHSVLEEYIMGSDGEVEFTTVYVLYRE